jgi:hypothetical protein
MPLKIDFTIRTPPEVRGKKHGKSCLSEIQFPIVAINSQRNMPEMKVSDESKIL